MENKNYKIVMDDEALLAFINDLPELTKDLTFYVCLFARSKYLPDDKKGEIKHIKSDKAQLKRFTATKHTLYSKLKQLECPLGSYLQYKTNVPSNPVPQETLAVYMTINPRSLRKATKGSVQKFIDMLLNNSDDPFNPSNFAMSEIQRSKGRTDWVIFDLDTKEIPLEEMKFGINGILGSGHNTNEEVYRIIETRGGYHILINPDNLGDIKGSFYNKMHNLFGKAIDQSGDIMIPIIGTHQGGWVPKFV